MQKKFRVRVKICCIKTPAEARLAIEAGADALGFVSEMPSGPGVISLQQMKSMLPLIPPPISVFLLTSKQTAEEIIQQHQEVPTDTLQLVNELPENEYLKLRKALNGVRLVQVIHIIGPESVNKALKLEPLVDALLLDSGNPSGEIPTLGGTGKTHNWHLSAEICRKTAKPVFLAGGLKDSNVKQAIEIVKPFAVDVCSGVRSNGQLDREKLISFFNQIQ